jgi:hypothetical protein
MQTLAQLKRTGHRNQLAEPGEFFYVLDIEYQIYPGVIPQFYVRSAWVKYPNHRGNLTGRAKPPAEPHRISDICAAQPEASPYL